MEAAVLNITNNITSYVIDYFTFYNKSSKSNSISYLEYRLHKFFKKENTFLKNKLLLYYEFNKNILDIPVIPYYISLFYQNLDYIVYCVKYSEWDEIMEIYKNIIKDNPNYKNSRITDAKHIYDRRYFLLVLYYIILIFIYYLSSYFYKFLSSLFYFLIDTFNITSSPNLTFLCAIIYLYLIFGIYYGGMPFIIFSINMVLKFAYYSSIAIYYFFYFIGLVFKIGVLQSFRGGNNNHKTKKIGGSMYNEFDTLINGIKYTFDDYISSFLIKIIKTILSYILPNFNTMNILDTQCSSTSTIERMLANHDNNRNTNEPINITKKLNNTIKNILPTNVQNNEFIKCMYKADIQKKPKCNK